MNCIVLYFVGPMLNFKQKEEKPARPMYLSQGRSNPFKVMNTLFILKGIKYNHKKTGSLFCK
jgi:hypothetical protein